jgi:PAS domain S-box-containing protein
MESKVNILLIEDNPADRDLIKIFLKGFYADTCNVTTADHLSDGLRLLAENTYEITIVDLSLPDSSGLETFNKVYAKAAHTPIIVLTGLEDESIGTNAVKLGAQDFLIKGKIKGKELARSINYSIERYKLLIELEEKAKELEEKTKALTSEKQKLSEAQKLARMGSWEWDLKKNKITWSDEFYNIHGLEPTPNAELSPGKLLGYIHPADKGYVQETLQNIIKSHSSSSFYYRIVRNDDVIRTLYSRGEVMLNDNGEAEKIVGTGQDVTERIQEEEMEKLAVAATKSYNSVVIADKHGLIEWVNEGFTKLTGYTLAEVKGTHGEDLRKGAKTGISEGTDYFKEVTVKKLPITYENKNYTKDGKEHWTITTLTPVLDKDGEVARIIAIDSDISERKEVEEDLVRANKIAEHSLMKGTKALNELINAKRELEESMRVKEQFLANMSHEIRTPMNAIVGFTDLLLKTALNDDQRQYIDAIKLSGENLLVILNDILDFSKMQAGKISFEQVQFRLSQVMSICSELMLHKSVEKGTKLSISISKNIPDRLIGDPTRLTQILLNLIGNAIKFTDKGEVKATVELVSETGEEVEIKFSVIDTGIGIPADKLTYIFDAFTQATNDTTRKYGGTGLGLAIVKQLVELYHGHISVTSKVNEGSIFCFTLKFSKDLSPEKFDVPEKKESNLPGLATGLRILLVEDNLLNQVLAKKVLTDWNWNVEVAENGLVAVEKVLNNTYDIVLMDIQLPEMDGYEATRQIRSTLPAPRCNTPIMAMTAHAISSEEEKCIAAGMDGYISKPFNQKTLYNKIISIVKPHFTNGNGVKINGIPKPQPVMSEMQKHIDLSYLRQLSNGDSKFIHEMLTLFMDQTPDMLARINKYMELKDWKSLGSAAHKMKPSIMFIGLKEIEADLRLVEDYASNELNVERIPAMVEKIKNVCTMAMDEIKEEAEYR